MEIISRAEAKQKGLNKYYTGQPCKNGHDAYRYTQSGTCSKCINAATHGHVDATVAVRREAHAELVLVRLRAFMEDREALAASAYALALMRYPMLLQVDVDPKQLPTGREPAGTALHAFYCHSSDVDQLREIAKGLLRRPTDVAQRRAQLIGQVVREHVEDTTPPESWR